MVSMCAREAISGTTPPNLACSVAEDIILLDNSFLPFITAAAVSSQLDSSPSITGSLFILKVDLSYIIFFSYYARRKNKRRA